MKKIILSFGLFLLFLGILSAQAPQKFNYQAVPRLAGGDLLVNQPVKVRFVLSEDGTTLVKYAEEQTVSTSLHGVLSAVIGDGGVSGSLPHDFSALDWSQHQYYLAVSLDLNGNNIFENNEVFSNSQLLSVPYAFYAEKAGNTGVVDNDTDPTNEFQQLSLSGNTISLSNGGGSVILPPSLGTDSQTLSLSGAALSISNGNSITLPDASATNEIQALSISGNAVSLSNGGGTINLPTEVDGSITNEIQALTLSNGVVSLSNGGGTVTLPDASATNEIQQISLTNGVISLSNGGGSITLPPNQGTDSQTLTLAGNNLSISNGNTVALPAEVDGSITNEIQALSIAGSVISLSNGGGSVTLPPNQGTDSQTLTLAGNNLSISNGNTVALPAEADGSITNEIQALSIAGNAVSLSNGGGTINLPAEVDGSITNEIQQLTLTNGVISLSNGGGSVTLPPNQGADSQTLTLAGNNLTISNGNTVALPAEVDGSVTNEIQALSITGNVVSLSNGGGTINLPAEVDGSVTNEIQALSIAGNVVSLSNGGGTINLPAEVDGSITNEIQTLSLNAGQLSLSNGGGTVSLPSTNTIAAGTGIAVTTVLNTTTISALNTTDMWNANLLRGRPIDGMAPEEGYVMAYAGAEGWKFYDNDLTITDGKLEVTALRGRPIDGMAPEDGYVMAFANATDGWVSYANDLSINNNRLEVAKIKGLNVDMAGAGPDMALTCMDDGNGGLEFRCIPAAGGGLPINYNGNSSTPLISITNSNTTNNGAVTVTNGGRYSIIGSTSKGDVLPIPISSYLSRTFTYPAGLRGRNTNTAQEGAGVYGISLSANTQGPGASGVGVGGFFQGGWIGAVGVGYEDGPAGVVGLKKAKTGDNTWPKENQTAIYGESDNDTWAYAGYFVGDVKITDDLNVNGTLTKSSGSFRIDHPLDPANKYLYHSFVESPDMKNIYDGVITTDANGFATVELPSYFQELNKDFRYQLTCIGTFAQAIISKKVDNNQFQIQTDKPGVEVSWQVTGIRKDPYAEAHRIQTEVEKTGFEKGKYTHPELYGQPESLKIAQKVIRH